MPSQAVKRISIRWLPEPAYEDTDTIALNVGGYFIDLRVTREDQTIQWSRAGERIMLKQSPRMPPLAPCFLLCCPSCASN